MKQHFYNFLQMRTIVLLRALLLLVVGAPKTLASLLMQHEGDFIGEIPTMADDEYVGKPWGLTTYANVPYLPCLSKGRDMTYDIAILGAPFDTVRAI